ncbi:phosphatidic acid phosphatase type 2/haloperoxidase [Xylogone sp. PMI_703]|nr:phosphatidic acid phosphatase type 2/haloperoxidase [Xylogone sp. PMI_703]
MARVSARLSVAVVLSYVLDWAVIIVGGVIGLLFSRATPNKRPFSLGNPDISFPHVQKEKVSSALLIVLGLAVPAGVIFLVSLLLVPGSPSPRNTPKSIVWRRKLWEWNAGWLGLGLSLAISWVVTSGVKNLIGKPRPDLLSRCNPDIAALAQFTIGGFESTGFLVTPGICQNQDKSIMDDGFRSFPSGHSSFSSAGLVYLSLFLAAKLGVWTPYLAASLRPNSADPRSFSIFTSEDSEHKRTDRIVPVRSQGAAAPLYLFAICLTPACVAIYVASTRFSDFRHHGFDILSGFVLGTTTAFFSFYYYQVPLRRGGGWSWGPRSAKRAFWAGVGKGGYVVDDDLDEYRSRNPSKNVDNIDTVETYNMVDLEAGRRLEGEPSSAHMGAEEEGAELLARRET